MTATPTLREALKQALDYINTALAGEMVAIDPTELWKVRSSIEAALSAPADSKQPFDLEEWIEREFSGYGLALREKADPRIAGEPYMEMHEAKALTRRAVALYAHPPADSKPGISEGHAEPCYYCGEPCNDLAGDPSRWSLGFPHRDDPGRLKWQHVGCVLERLIENHPPADSLEAAIAELPPNWCCSISYWQGNFRMRVYDNDMAIAGKSVEVTDPSLLAALRAAIGKVKP